MYRESSTRGDTMTTLTHRDPGPDKRAAEMSDSDEAGDPVGRQRQHAWVPGSAALLTWLIGLSDILAIFRPDLVHKLHKINYLGPGTLNTVTPPGRSIIGVMLCILAHS